jgi:hypothetical protein
MVKSKIVNKKAVEAQNKEDMDFNDLEDLFYEGLSDSEIADEIGVNEGYIKKVREDILNDF